jgi:hypothetical protein
MLVRQQQPLGLNYGQLVVLESLFPQSLLQDSTWYFILHLMLVLQVLDYPRPGLLPLL